MTYDRMAGSVGSLMLVWAKIEQSARDEVVRAHGHLPKSAYGIAALLRIWESTVIEKQPATSLYPLLAKTLRVSLNPQLEMRNGVCHGLVGISATREGMNGELHWEINNERYSSSWEDLQTSLSWLSKIHYAISIISNSSIERIGDRGIDDLENRKWWQTEFGLNL
jgi:hypothetical protein